MMGAEIISAAVVALHYQPIRVVDSGHYRRAKYMKNRNPSAAFYNNVKQDYYQTVGRGLDP